MIKNYFSELPKLKSTERTFKESDFIGYRDSEGYLVLPGDWNDDKEFTKSL